MEDWVPRTGYGLGTEIGMGKGTGILRRGWGREKALPEAARDRW